MKIILLEDIRGKGKKDDVIEVADGFGMHLISQKKAVNASKGSMKVLKKQHQDEATILQIQKEKALEDKKVLEKAKLNFQLNVGKDGKVFKSISHKQIINKVLCDYGIKLDKKKFKNNQVINTLGVHKIKVELAKDVDVELSIHVKEQ